jgi:hypothetical protein
LSTSTIFDFKFREVAMAEAQSVRDVAGAGVRRRDRAIGVAAAVLGAVVVWVLARAVFGQDLIVEQAGRAPQEVDIVPVLVFSLVPALAGWALLAALERFAGGRARVVWTAIALVVLLLSFAPIFQVGATGATKVFLALMHVAVGAAVIPAFWRTSVR